TVRLRPRSSASVGASQSSRRAHSMSRAPASPSPSAISCPRPREPPVTMATRPLRSKSCCTFGIGYPLPLVYHVPHTRAARLSIIAAALLFSTGGAAIKGTAMTAFQVAGFRSGVAAVAIALLLPGARRGLRPDLLPAAVAYAATLIFFVLATKLTTAAAA